MLNGFIACLVGRNSLDLLHEVFCRAKIPRFTTLSLQEVLNSAGLLKALESLENNDADADDEEEEEGEIEGQDAEDELSAAFAKAGIN